MNVITCVSTLLIYMSSIMNIIGQGGGATNYSDTIALVMTLQNPLFSANQIH